MKRNLNNKLLKAVQKGLSEALSNYDLTALDDEDSVLVKNNIYKHSSIYDDIIDKNMPKFLDNNEIFKDTVEKMILIDRQYTVKNKNELKLLIKKSIKVFGNECDLNWIDTSQITDMSYLFYDMTKFNGHIEKWDVSNVKDMNSMFSWAYSFNQLIGDWNVSNVKNMADMFNNACSFNQPIGNWNVSNVENMSSMFSYAYSFNQPISDWDASNVNTYNMFFECPIKEEYKPKFK